MNYESLDLTQSESQSVIECEKVNYHRECYKRFTNKTHLTRAMKEKEKLKEKTLNDATVQYSSSYL